MSLRKYQGSLTEELVKVHEREPQSKLTKNRYRAIRVALIKSYPNLINSTDKEVMLNFLRDVVYLDRKQRLLTEGLERDEKEELSQEYQIEHLGVEIGLENNIKQLKNL